MKLFRKKKSFFFKFLENMNENDNTNVPIYFLLIGEPASLQDTTNPDWLPFSASKIADRFGRRMNRNIRKRKSDPEVPPPVLEDATLEMWLKINI